jgi:hypothetical protein
MNLTSLAKMTARHETIVKLYRRLFHLSALPLDRQYWTMCGPCTADGHPDNRSELGQLLAARLITPSQWRGVDIQVDIQRSNQGAYPGLIWICDDFYRAMSLAFFRGDFRPGIVNADLIQEPKAGTLLIADTLALLGEVEPPVMLVANYVLKLWRTKRKTQRSVIRYLRQEVSNAADWRLHSEWLSYRNGRTRMGTFIFYRTMREEHPLVRGQKEKKGVKHNRGPLTGMSESS